MVPSAAIFSARVLDEHLKYDPELLLEHQLDDLVTYFVDTYPRARVFNLSIGNADSVFDGNKQSPLAAAIDDIAYRLRERDILFVVSAGNYLDDSPEAMVGDYPKYLQSPDARLIEPATSAISLTVGESPLVLGTDPSSLRATGTEQTIAQTQGWPSPFTRVGLGVNDALKPDVVDFAGDISLSEAILAFFILNSRHPKHIKVVRPT